MISVFYGNDEESHQKFQAWRRANGDGFHMTESAPGQFTIHYTQDKRERATHLAGHRTVIHAIELNGSRAARSDGPLHKLAADNGGAFRRLDPEE
jgi:hypothetical protein